MTSLTMTKREKSMVDVIARAREGASVDAKTTAWKVKDIATTVRGFSAQRMQARAAALAWNAAFRGEPRDMVKPNAMGEFFLLGTPWATGLKVG